MKQIFNTIFENSVRILIILYRLKKPVSSDMLSILDFLNLYNNTLGLGGKDLNGKNSFAFCEYLTRQSIIKESVKDLALYGLIDINKTVNGFCYSINNKGEIFVESLTDKYKNDYLANLKYTLDFVGAKKEKTLIAYINEKTTNGGNND